MMRTNLSLRLLPVLAGLLLAAATLTAAPPRAEACGGCFTPTDAVTSVDSHRMVIALSTTETILWDQIRYTGDPLDFVWVLPVPSADARVEVADPAFFDELDAQTAPIIQPARPLMPCSFAASCGGGDGAGASGEVDAPYMPEEGVTVYSEDTVGPYETVIIGSEDADALRLWLVDHGYRVAPETEPVLDHYIGLGSVFVVLRLSPSQGVQAMQPVRVRYPGYMAQFPLKMVTVGARGALGLSLWVIAGQRYAARNYATLTIDRMSVVWDWAAGRSNYTQLFDRTIDQAGGRAWITEYASPLYRLWISSPEIDLVEAIEAYPYVTRLRTRMLVDHLEEDLELTPAGDNGEVSASITAWSEVNRPGGDCDEAASERYGCAAAAVSARLGQVAGPTLLILALLTWRWRTSRRRRPR